MRVSLLIMLFKLVFPSDVTLNLSSVTVATSHAPDEIATSDRKNVAIQVRKTKRRK